MSPQDLWLGVVSVDFCSLVVASFSREFRTMETHARTEACKSLVANGTYQNGSPYVTIQGENQGGEDEHDEMSRDEEDLKQLKNGSSGMPDKVKKPSDTEPKVMTPTRVDVEVRFETLSMRFADRWRRRKKSKVPAAIRVAEEGLADGIEDVESLVEEATRLESEVMHTRTC